MPLTAERFALDWDAAVSLVGHDPEIKETYDALLAAPDPPDLFIDIGANYGTHSLLFLVHRIATMTFEPNVSCHHYFQEACNLNGVTPALEPVALGERCGRVELSYPQDETWLGSTSAAAASALASRSDLRTVQVEQRTLDDYLPKIFPRRTLIKIDAEGSELAILRGAVKTLQELRPSVIFECWRNTTDRSQLFAFFANHGYDIHGLPWKPGANGKPLSLAQFTASSSLNFLALPINRRRDLCKLRNQDGIRTAWLSWDSAAPY